MFKHNQMNEVWKEGVTLRLGTSDKTEQVEPRATNHRSSSGHLQRNYTLTDRQYVEDLTTVPEKKNFTDFALGNNPVDIVPLFKGQTHQSTGRSLYRETLHVLY